VERIGQDLHHPRQRTQPALEPQQLQHAEEQAADAEGKPGDAHVVHEATEVRGRADEPEERRLQPQQQRHAGPQAHQHHLAADVVADLHRFLVRVAHLVDVVEAARLEEEVAALPRHHRDAPADDGRQRRVHEQQHIGHEEAEGADEVQRLVDAALVIEAVVVPPLLRELAQEGLHGQPFRKLEAQGIARAREPVGRWRRRAPRCWAAAMKRA